MSVVDHESFAQALMVYAREEVARNESLRAHPTPAKLAAYHADELSETEDLAIQRHLAICSECPALLIDLEDLFEPRQRDLGLSDSWVASAWDDLRSRLGGKKGTGGPPPQVKAPWWAWLSAALRSPVLATGLAVVCLGLITSLIYLDSTENFSDLNPGRVTLLVDAGTRGPTPKPPLTTIEFEPGQKKIVVEFPLGSLRHYDEYDVHIRNDSGENRRPVRGLKRQVDGFLRMTLNRGDWAPGKYELDVTVPEDDSGEERVVKEFSAKIVYR